jgi:hypothetical protein
VAAAAVGCGSSGQSWRVVAKAEVFSGNTVANIGGNVVRPTAIQVRVEAEPKVTSQTSYSADCGNQVLEGKSGAARTPNTTTIPVPPGRPSSCVVLVNVKKPARVHMTVTLLARSRPAV